MNDVSLPFVNRRSSVILRLESSSFNFCLHLNPFAAGWKLEFKLLACRHRMRRLVRSVLVRRNDLCKKIASDRSGQSLRGRPLYPKAPYRQLVGVPEPFQEAHPLIPDWCVHLQPRSPRPARPK